MWLPLIISLAVSAAATPVLIYVARKMGWVVAPRNDRWHKNPTAIFGGVAIYLAFAVSFLLNGSHDQAQWALFLCGSAMFGLGLWDDIHELKPQVKFLSQIVISIVAVSLGLRLDQEIIPWVWVSMPLALFWFVGITNAVNILDNMDGLSSGVVCVASAVIAVGAQPLAGSQVPPLAMMICGAALGFLIYNFNPAKIFMGDCGSLFLGFTLAGLTILSTNTAAEVSHIALSILIPLGALVVPIFDTTLVSYQRASHGRSIAQGGRDHSSHRLVFLGLSERRAVLVLLLISLAGGAGSLLLVNFATPLVAAVIVALILVILMFFGIYLGEVKVYGADSQERWKSPILHTVIMYKRQLLQITVDLVLLTAAYTGAWLLRYDGNIPGPFTEMLTDSLPWLLGVKMVTFWFFGLYKGHWRYVSVHDVVQIFKACLVGSIIFVVLLVVVTRFEAYSRGVMVTDLILCIMFVAGTRFLIRVFREKVSNVKGRPVLIMGAGDGGELLLRELRNNQSLLYKPVGFVDDDPYKKGSVIHGIRVLGSRKDIPELCRRYKVERVFISILSAKKENFAEVFALCEQAGVKCDLIQPMVCMTLEG